MSDNPFVAFNVLTVPEQARETLEQRFAGRAGEVEKMPGFRHFELLRPISGTDSYLVYTRWESKQHFDAWVESMQFRQGHAQASDQPPAATGSQVWTFEAIQMADSADQHQGDPADQHEADPADSQTADSADSQTADPAEC